MLVQAREFARVLPGMGYEVAHVRLGLNLGIAIDALRALAPRLVVNLVESVAGSDALQYLGPAILDYLRIPYTGSPTHAVLLSADKLLGKERLASGGVPTPPWCSLEAALCGATPGEPPWIVKPVAEHASYAIEDASVTADRDALRGRAAGLETKAYFVERYIEGRELNVSLIAGSAGIELLPIAEIDFAGFPPGRPRIVGYRAKWDPGSVEYRATPRTFRFAGADRGLLEEVGALARRSWELVGLHGYGRVDFRVDRDGRPWVLEVNANPCLSPDAGFAAAAAQAGIRLEDVLRRIVENARESR